MNGIVDEDLRALLDVPVAAEDNASRQQLRVWIDTAFNGGLVIPLDQIEALGLIKESSAEAILADGSRVELETYACFVDWFGTTLQTQVVANQGAYPLLGTMLLDRRKLVVDYESKVVELD